VLTRKLSNHIKFNSSLQAKHDDFINLFYWM